MEREHTPGPAESGLSTDDLAAPQERDLGDRPEAQSQGYPGEAAGATSEAEAVPPAASTVPREPEPAADTQGTSAQEDMPQLLTAEDETGFRTRWQEIQNRFVDDPREAVHEADGLVADVMQALASTFSQHKKDLEGQWSQGEEADTEDLRRALRKYRSFFNRLLSS
ncbi:hypothetical protein [Streptomyces peucetius]|uniref:Uncharacterized protein n=1 Tax=Streptomyces peucetius TaxID=1950 RepID=A0ABY6ICH4_STRPE|nr:hypothetical protein [Streptomyces peucetius]UYQ64683.1 hypothetical protein OGH68_26650 [Streptomyces peucetius]